MKRVSCSTGVSEGIRRAAAGTLWHRADPFAVLAFALCCACGGNSASAADPDRDGGGTPDAGAPNDGGPDADVPDDADIPDSDVPEPDPSFDSDDPAPCGGGTVWEQISDAAEADAQAKLSTLSGYTERGLAVYRGSAEALDNRGEAYIDGNGELSGAVLAKLEPNMGDLISGPGHTLTVKSLVVEKYFVVFQPTGAATTQVSAITPWNSTLYNVGETSPSGEVPSLVSEPELLSFDLFATGSDQNPGSPFQVEASATLMRVEPVTFPDVVTLARYGDTSLEDFEESADGREFVREVLSGVSIPSCVPEGSGFAPGECNYGVAYSVEEYVEANDLDVHGLRNFEITHVLMDCYHCTRSEGSSDSYRCLEGRRNMRWP